MPDSKTHVRAVLIAAMALTSGLLPAQDMKDQPVSGGQDAGMEAHMRGHSYEMDNAHSRVSFKIRHLAVSNVRGRFGDVKASIFIDPTDVTTLSTEALISVASVDTEDDRRDNDLRSDGFFDVATFPEMKFVSTGVSDVGEAGTFKLHGQLTIRDVTKDVVLDAEMSGPIVNRGQERLGFVATTRIDRFDYDLKWSALTEAGSLVAGRDVDIIIEIEARRKIE